MIGPSLHGSFLSFKYNINLFNKFVKFTKLNKYSNIKALRERIKKDCNNIRELGKKLKIIEIKKNAPGQEEGSPGARGGGEK